MAKIGGYYMVDHRAGPGLPADFYYRQGIDLPGPVGGRLFEADILTCGHCSQSHIKNPERTRDRAYCRQCDHYICDGCQALATHPDYLHRSISQLIDIMKNQEGRATPLADPFALSPLLKGR